MTVTESTTINADPATVYRLVSDVARMGEWSPEATGAFGAQGQLGVGDRFVGRNKRGPVLWWTVCTVRQAEPGVRFAFDVDAGPAPISRWIYELRPTEQGGTELVETWIDRRRGPLGVAVKGLGQLFIPGSRPEHNRRNMRATLAALKQAAESTESN